jgi:hypothetical protein
MKRQWIKFSRNGHTTEAAVQKVENNIVTLLCGARVVLPPTTIVTPLKKKQG